MTAEETLTAAVAAADAQDKAKELVLIAYSGELEKVWATMILA